MISQLSLAIKSAWRHFLRNRTYSSLNIMGLGMAFVVTILLASYVHQEVNYEDFHEHADRIYRATYRFESQNNFETHFARVPKDFINELPEAIPEIEKLIRFQNKEQKYIRIGEERFKPKHAYVTDADVFEVFSFQMIAGIKQSALSDPLSVVLTETTAKRYFGHTNVVGEQLYIVSDWSTEEKVYQVTGVMKDLPANTHLPVDLLFSFTDKEERKGWAYVYTLLRENTAIETINSKIGTFISSHTEPDEQNKISFIFQPLRDIHLHSHLAREIVVNGQVFYIKIFFWSGLLIWFIALINFSNLGAAIAMGRGKEIGVHKTLGADRLQVVLFTMTESVGQSIAALLFGILLSSILFPSFQSLTGTPLSLPLQSFFPLLLLAAVSTGLLAGVLPSLVVGSMKTLQILKMGNQWSLKRKTHGTNIKRIMVTAQFAITVSLVGSSIVAFQQFRFIGQKNLGIKTDQILTIAQVPGDVTENFQLFKNRLKEIQGVLAVAGCMQLPSSEIRDVGPVTVLGAAQTNDDPPMMDVQIIDSDFVPVMGLELLAGVDFTSDQSNKGYPKLDEDGTIVEYLSATPRKYLINETAAHLLGWMDPHDALGKEINWSIENLQLAYGPITGVIKDYHQESLRNKIDPLILTSEPIWWSNFLVQIAMKEVDQTIPMIEQSWNNMFPYAFEYSFLDEQFAQLYKQDYVQLKLLTILTIIAISLSFLGLISLVAFTLRTREKEMAIRRVVGANLTALSLLIGKEYFGILAIASLIGIPVSLYWVSKWMENFAYHIDVSVFLYIPAILIMLIFLTSIIYLQTLGATLKNPLRSLRDE